MDYSTIAHLYDICVKTDFDIVFFLEEVRACGEVLELMSGTGRLSIPLLKAGVRLTCVDACPAMLDILKDKLTREGLSAEICEMDVCALDLARQFDLIIIPFNSFAEIVRPGNQRKALVAIREHLAEGGRFICTLSNPAVRLQVSNGQLRELGRYPLPDDDGILILRSTERLDARTHVVTGKQFYELYNADEVMLSESCLDLEFYVHQSGDLRNLVESLGYRILHVYGDYTRAEFQENTSPYMIWILTRTDTQSSATESTT